MLAIEHPLVVVEKTLVTTLEDRVKKVEVNGFHGIWFDSLVSRSDFVPSIHFVEEVGSYFSSIHIINKLRGISNWTIFQA